MKLFLLYTHIYYSMMMIHSWPNFCCSVSERLKTWNESLGTRQLWRDGFHGLLCVFLLPISECLWLIMRASVERLQAKCLLLLDISHGTSPSPYMPRKNTLGHRFFKRRGPTDPTSSTTGGVVVGDNWIRWDGRKKLRLCLFYASTQCR